MTEFIHYAAQAGIAATMFTAAGILGRVLWEFDRKER